MSQHSLAHDFAVDGAKALPVAGYGASVLAGIDWGTWAAFLACLYTGWLLVEKAVKLWKAWRVHQAKHA